jgi:hypothetical protein
MATFEQQKAELKAQLAEIDRMTKEGNTMVPTNDELMDLIREQLEDDNGNNEIDMESILKEVAMRNLNAKEEVKVEKSEFQRRLDAELEGGKAALEALKRLEGGTIGDAMKEQGLTVYDTKKEGVINEWVKVQVAADRLGTVVQRINGAVVAGKLEEKKRADGVRLVNYPEVEAWWNNRGKSGGKNMKMVSGSSPWKAAAKASWDQREKEEVIGSKRIKCTFEPSAEKLGNFDIARAYTISIAYDNFMAQSEAGTAQRANEERLANAGKESLVEAFTRDGLKAALADRGVVTSNVLLVQHDTLSGARIVTQPLMGVRGLKRLKRIVRIMNEQGLELNKFSDTRVSIDVTDFTVEQLKRLALLYYIFEGSIDSFIVAHRRKNFSKYLRSMKLPYIGTLGNATTYSKIMRTFSAEMGKKAVDSRFKLNFADTMLRGTVEFRHYQATLDIEELTIWTRFCMAMVSAAREEIKLDDLKDDFNMMADTLDLDNEVFRYLKGRRAALLQEAVEYERSREDQLSALYEFETKIEWADKYESIGSRAIDDLKEELVDEYGMWYVHAEVWAERYFRTVIMPVIERYRELKEQVG